MVGYTGVEWVVCLHVSGKGGDFKGDDFDVFYVVMFLNYLHVLSCIIVPKSLITLIRLTYFVYYITFTGGVKSMHFSFDEPRLFGDVQAQHEDDAIFNDYVYIRDDFDCYWDIRKPFLILNAATGSGKSAVCRIIQSQVLSNNPSHFCILCYNDDVSPIMHEHDSIDSWMTAWKNSLLNQIALHIGKYIKTAVTDDAMALVELARLEGIRELGIINAIKDRIKESKFPIITQNAERKITTHLIQRVLSNDDLIWLIIDEVDILYDNSLYYRKKLISFLNACLNLRREIKQLRIRCTIRPTTWTQLSLEDGSISRLSAYLTQLNWSEKHIEALLSNRILSYLKHRNNNQIIKQLDRADDRNKAAVELLFTGNFDLGNSSRPPSNVLYKLCHEKPRYLIELCQAARKKALEENLECISYDIIERSMFEFGEARIIDLSNEYKGDCMYLRDIYRSFAGSAHIFRQTNNLLEFIDTNVIPNVRDTTGSEFSLSDIKIAGLLYKTGFIDARVDYSNNDYRHIHYSESPHLLKNRKSALRDTSISWEIHPVFRNTLYLVPGRKNIKTKRRH